MSDFTSSAVVRCAKYTADKSRPNHAGVNVY